MAGTAVIYNSQTPRPRRRLSLTAQIFIGLTAGVVLGGIVNNIDPSYASVFKPFSDAFLRMIKMIIAPIIFASLVAGIAGAGQAKKVGRMGLRALIFFEILTFFALAVGLIMVNLVKPGVGAKMPEQLPTGVEPRSETWAQMLVHAVPTSIIQAMAEGDVLQIVIFSILFAISLGMLKERAKPVVELCEIVAAAMFKFTHIIMHYAPLGVGAAMAFTIGTSGLSVLLTLTKLLLTLYAALAIFIVIVLIPSGMFLGLPIRKFLTVVKEPAIIAFSTTSSEAALPRSMEGLECLGVPRRVVSFVLPLGYSFNLMGTTLYLSLAAVFVAQAAQVDLTIGQQIAMLLTLMLTSKGVAAVPRASLIILAGTLTSYGLPLQGITLILGVDSLMDMGRTTVNVIGNCLATVAVARWEGEFNEASDETIAKFIQESD